MTRTEKIKLIREKYPNISQGEVDDIVKELNTKSKIEQFRKTGVTQVLAGSPLTGAVGAAKAGASAVGKLAKTFVPKTTKGKVIAGTAGIFGAGMFESIRGNQAEAQTAALNAEQTAQEEMQNQNNASLQFQLATYEAQGGDVNALLSTPMGQQLLKNPTYDSKALFGTDLKLPGNIGVYVGAPAYTGPKTVRGQAVAQPTGVISMQQWKQRFPLANPQELAAWKQTLVNAGVVDASVGLPELQKQWDAWGEYSQNSVRMGNNLSPYDLLNIQKGLWGGGGGEASYNVNLIKKANSRELLKQFMEADTGQIISDAEADDFANLIRKKQLEKPTKTETKMVKGKRVTVTTPGFGESEAAKLAEKRAMQDPMYAEFQTANVFGSALEKALGVRG